MTYTNSDENRIPNKIIFGKNNLIESLHRLHEFKTWNANWDGEGSPAPNRDTIVSAMILLGMLFINTNGAAPYVTMNASSEPMFIFNENSIDMTITIKSKNEISFYIEKGDYEDAGLLDFDTENFPDELKSIIHKIFLS